MANLVSDLRADVRRKATWCYGNDRWPALFKTLATDGTAAMICFRLMEWSRRWRIIPLALFFNKLNAATCGCVIGRGAQFGPGFVLVHSHGVFINSGVRGGTNVTIYHQVTIGGEGAQVPCLGDDVVLSAGAKVIGPVRLGAGARVAPNSVVVGHVAPGTTVLGIPARPVWQAQPQPVHAENGTAAH